MKKLLIVVGLVSTLALTACGRTNVAATLGDMTITQSKVQVSIDAILAERAQVDTTNMQLRTGADLNRGQVRTFIIYAIFDNIARELKVDVTPTEIATRKAEILNQIGGQQQLRPALVGAQIAPQDFEAYIRASLISDKLTKGLIATGVSETDASAQLGQLLMKKAEQLKITINPRYGTWDGTSGDVVEADNSLGAVNTATR